jgi:hypothetical protein
MHNMPLQHFYEHHFDGMVTLNIKYNDLKKETRELQEFVEHLQASETAEKTKVFKAAVKERLEMNAFFSHFENAMGF